MLKRLGDHSQLNFHSGGMLGRCIYIHVRSLLRLCVGLRHTYTAVLTVTICMHQKQFEVGLSRTAAAYIRDFLHGLKMCGFYGSHVWLKKWVKLTDSLVGNRAGFYLYMSCYICYSYSITLPSAA